ncbi:hypothetical protein [Haloplanus halophilus]|uniref:DUF7853 family protein n=1 Tax=Haloplanus halophilus TaxID=2949993 RepID=UPI00203B1D79|nr:hypothetical protein [Haloplanus sp. GDY1]
MSPSTCHGPDGVDLSREEAWVLHAAVLDHVERTVEAGRSPDRGVAILKRIEACEPLDPADRAIVRDALATYLPDAPERDRASARAILAALDGQASSSQ